MDRDRLAIISKWGTAQWASMRGALNGCDNLEFSATDISDVSRVTDMSSAISDTRIERIPNFDLWDVSRVRNMSRMFYLNQFFNSPIGNWNVSGVINMSQMFYFAGSWYNSNGPLLRRLAMIILR